MENFIVSARKYRPDSFASVVGQTTTTQTLKNAIKSNHIAQAYLFCGPRGVGKTTCARIFAKTINCFSISPDFEACNACESCNGFNQSRSFNIHELDAASNNSVEDIRNLIDQVRIPPQIGKYNVYIIDEVHMLSQAAFNAFLKTLEEPPSHAVFILATTEKHKIIPTILSRCQIFDFNRIRLDDIVNYLELIAKKEKVVYEREALHIIGQKADGSMRDALSIFDQVVSFTENKVTYQNTIQNLNVLDYEYYFRLVSSFLEGNHTEPLLIFNEILNKGFDSHQFINGLSGHFRDLLVCKNPQTIQLLEVSESIKQRYLKQAGLCSNDFLFDLLEINNSCDLAYKNSNNKRLLVELTLIKLANLLDSKKKISQPAEIDKAEEKAVDYQVKPLNIIETAVSPVKTKEQPKPSKKSTISIKDAMLDVQVPSKMITDSDQPQKGPDEKFASQFTQQQLENSWKEFAQTIADPKPRLFSTLIASSPQLIENNKIDFIVSNQLQKDAVLEMRQELISFLEGHLKNNIIELDIKIQEVIEGPRLYTQEDKFKYMNEKNPNLGVLKQKLNLDFE